MRGEATEVSWLSMSNEVAGCAAMAPSRVAAKNIPGWQDSTVDLKLLHLHPARLYWLSLLLKLGFAPLMSCQSLLFATSVGYLGVPIQAPRVVTVVVVLWCWSWASRPGAHPCKRRSRTAGSQVLM